MKIAAHLFQEGATVIDEASLEENVKLLADDAATILQELYAYSVGERDARGRLQFTWIMGSAFSPSGSPENERASRRATCLIDIKFVDELGRIRASTLRPGTAH